MEYFKTLRKKILKFIVSVLHVYSDKALVWLQVFILTQLQLQLQLQLFYLQLQLQLSHLKY